ncbi:MAG TPA: hypothetical protein ENJ84_00280 [Gammaproteobacteria bacterium]|nr:hypothetical protein [Gammaproteobacteria bacterium]
MLAKLIHSERWPHSDRESDYGQVRLVQNQPSRMAVFVAAQKGCVIPGLCWLNALQTLGLTYGSDQIFHRHVVIEGQSETLFYAINAMKPWLLPMDQMKTKPLKGIALMMALPTLIDTQEAVEFFLGTAVAISEEVGGRVLMEDKSDFTVDSRTQFYGIARNACL